MLIPASVSRAYGIEAATATRIPSLINDTFVAEARRDGGTSRIVVQRLHPVFGREVHRDIEAVTQHLSRRGMATPRLIHTDTDELDHVCEGDSRPWRALSFVPGVTVHRSREADQLRSAAALLARFHRSLADLEHSFESVRPLHDTPRHLAFLRSTLTSTEALQDEPASELGAQVLQHARDIQTSFEEQPVRVVHGDPKLSNLLFLETDPRQAHCLIDLDTVGRGPLALELGDALRSWCNPAGEDAARATLEPTLVQAVLGGYFEAAPRDLGAREAESVIAGLETVSCELASRFAADAIQGCYFGWDDQRFESRREHNLVRARLQLSLSRQVRDRRDELIEFARMAYDAAVAGW